MAPLTSRGPDNQLPLLAELGSDQRWQQLQRLRRGSGSPQPWLEALATGRLAAEPDWLAALVGSLDRLQAEHLLALSACRPEPLLEALRRELPAAGPAVRELWLEPLLGQSLQVPAAQRADWLSVLGLWRDPRVAQLLRQAATAEPLADHQLLVLLGYQRQAEDAPLLQQRALEPGHLALREAALEGLAVGLTAWPLPPLRHTLATLAEDLHPALAGKAVDLLARLPDAQNALQQLRRRRLDPVVAERLQRRLRRRPLVLIVHGRQGGLIPPELQELASDLAARRGAPVLLQALTAEPPQADGAFWESARRAEGFTLVPLMLLPGGHVRHDIPAIAARWRGLGPLRRLPFLGAWPAWQRALAEELAELEDLAPAPVQAGSRPLVLHHPLEGPLAARYLDLLERRTGARCVATPYSASSGDGLLSSLYPDLVNAGRGQPPILPLALAANRLTDSLAALVGQPLLQRPRFRQLLRAKLEALP